MPSDPTPLTEEARRQATLAAGIAYEGDLQFGFIKGWDAAKVAAEAFYSERERALRGALRRAAEGLDMAAASLRSAGSNQNAEFAAPSTTDDLPVDGEG